MLLVSYGTGNLCVLPRLPAGRLGDVRNVVQHHDLGPDPRQNAPHDHVIAPDPDGRLFLAFNLGRRFGGDAGVYLLHVIWEWSQGVSKELFVCDFAGYNN